MSIDKKALFNLSSEPYLKPISDLGVGFYNLDENTAVLQFQLSNSKGPLLISENNLTAYAYFESANGSASDVIELDIIDGIKGLVEITLDTAFLQASTSTTVKGQVYIAVNNHDDDPTYNEVAVFREFTFEVADALINKISAFTKVENIRMFNQLKIHIEQRVNDIDAAIANGEDYVAQMNATLLNGKTQLNQIVTDGTATIDGSVTQAKVDVTAKIDSATSEITTLSNNTKTDVQNTADNAITEITNTSNTATTHVDTKVAEFNQTVLDNGFVQPEELQNKINSLQWQKIKTTLDDGNIQRIDNPDFTNPQSLLINNSGIYYIYQANTTDTGISSRYGYLQILKANNNAQAEIIFRPFSNSQINSNESYSIKKSGDIWGKWNKTDIFQTDTGWIPFQLINGAKSNTNYKKPGENGFDCAYRTIKNGTSTERIVRLNGRMAIHGQVIAQLPSTFCKNDQTFPIRVPVKYSGAFVRIRSNGEINFYVQGDRSDWNDEDLFYGEFTWRD